MANVELGPFVTVEQLGRYKNKSDEAYAITEGKGIEIEGRKISLGDMVNDSGDGPIYSASAHGWAEQQVTTGKNLLQMKSGTTISSFAGAAVVVGEGSVAVNGTANSSGGGRNTRLSETATLQPGTYTLSFSNIPSALAVFIEDSSNDTIIAGTGNGFTFTLVETKDVYFGINLTPNASYSNATISNIQLELGSTATAYEPYTGGAPSPSPDYPQEIKVAKGRNLLDESAATNGKRLTSDGSLSTNADYSVSDYISIDANETYFGTNLAGSSVVYTSAWYDSSKTFISISNISGSGSQSRALTAPANAKYIRVTYLNSASGTVQLELGSTPTPYVPYGHVGLEVQGRNFAKIQSGNNTVIGSIKANKTYVFSADFTSNCGFSLKKNSANGEILVDTSTYVTGIGRFSISLTSDSDCDVFINGYAQQGTFVGSASSYQLELGSTAHSYQPYYHETRAIPLPSKGFAASLPDGTTDKLAIDSAGKWEWESVSDEKVFDGSTIAVSSVGQDGEVYQGQLNIGSNHSAYQDTPMLCSHFIQTSGWKVDGGIKQYGNSVYLCTLDQSLSTVSAWNTWLSTNNVTSMLALATPTTESGYVDLPMDIPEGSTITIPELEDVGVRCFVPGAKELAEHAANWGKRSRHEDEEIEDAIADLAERVATLETPNQE